MECMVHGNYTLPVEVASVLCQQMPPCNWHVRVFGCEVLAGQNSVHLLVAVFVHTCVDFSYRFQEIVHGWKAFALRCCAGQDGRVCDAAAWKEVWQLIQEAIDVGDRLIS